MTSRRLILPLATALALTGVAWRADAQPAAGDPFATAPAAGGLPGLSLPDPGTTVPSGGAPEALPGGLAPDGPVPDGTAMERSAPSGGLRPDVAGQAELLPGLIDAQIKPCWTVPVLSGDPAEGGLARIRVELLPDGTLAAPPAIIDKPAGRLGGVFADYAAQAIVKCAPFELPPESYQSWKSLMIVFDTLDF